MVGRYTIARFRPDPMREEFRNCAAVAWDAQNFLHARDWRVPSAHWRAIERAIEALRAGLWALAPIDRVGDRALAFVAGLDTPYSSVYFREPCGTIAAVDEVFLRQIMGWFVERDDGVVARLAW